MAYKRATRVGKNGYRSSVTVNTGGTRSKSGVTYSWSNPAGKGSNYSKRLTTALTKDGRIKHTYTTNNGGWITRISRLSSDKRKLKIPRGYTLGKKDSFRRKVELSLLLALATFLSFSYFFG